MLQNLVFAILIADNQLVTMVRMKKYSLQASDIHLIFNLVSASESFKAAESWTPICLPNFDSRWAKTNNDSTDNLNLEKTATFKYLITLLHFLAFHSIAVPCYFDKNAGTEVCPCSPISGSVQCTYF